MKFLEKFSSEVPGENSIWNFEKNPRMKFLEKFPDGIPEKKCRMEFLEKMSDGILGSFLRRHFRRNSRTDYFLIFGYPEESLL